jgi:hypothetical protein
MRENSMATDPWGTSKTNGFHYDESFAGGPADNEDGAVKQVWVKVSLVEEVAGQWVKHHLYEVEASLSPIVVLAAHALVRTRASPS